MLRMGNYWATTSTTDISYVFLPFSLLQSTPVVLHLLDIAPMMGVLEGVVMELQDCALPLLVDVQAFCEEDKVGFRGENTGPVRMF